MTSTQHPAAALTPTSSTSGEPAGRTGWLERVAGPVVTAAGLPGVRLFDVVRVGAEGLPGEAIRIERDLVTVQVFEDTTGLRVGDPVVATGTPLLAELGPGLLGSIVDGTGRPLELLAGTTADGAPRHPFVPRGADPPHLDRTRRWDFRPAVRPGRQVEPGDLLGTVAETAALEHRVLVPHGISGTVTAVHPGPATVEEPVVLVDDRPVPMLRRWPVREPRPVRARLPLDRPLVTGQRVLDVLFPLAAGGSAIIPGGFGTGKTMTEQTLAKHAAADVVVYVGCGERGNELTEVLQEFPELVDPRNGAPLMERTVLVANTSNMPVAAREASIYTGMTVAEYFRDQGYDVALMADSTSRWGEALREVSTRLEEIPAEDGYPAYLASRLAGFYERSGRVVCLGGSGGTTAPSERLGSVTVVGAVSPAGGDFSEPITQNSLRLAGSFWALDTTLARQRHYPAVNWTRSFSQYDVAAWFDAEVAPDWSALRSWALALLQQEGALQDVVQLLGMEALAPEQRVVLRTGQLLRQVFLQQSSFDDRDASCAPRKSVAMLRVLHEVHQAMTAALGGGVDVGRLVTCPELGLLAGMKQWDADDADTEAGVLGDRVRRALAAL
ncbi:ATP synthase subunit A [Modestobacter marinus]|uniref:V-type ATP synthase alpha chain n=1 Tax=Modestobacter marinus TaxID=477641 RepID=A0A846LBU2_9ACTN|nr:V-type ATP synthase subunit A [Modestobacter marinus]NIH65573.1 V/A-type H+-transporting ATPase subunit A [Modestobacter marinus]GGL65506.1 ATP synthase subunit A [Modestobacter marinus]